MRKFILAAALACGLCLSAATNAADEKKDDKGKTYTGVLIDNACGGKQKDATAAAKHPKSCAAKESCAKSGYQVIVGDKHLKFDEKGNTLAKEYLAGEESTTAVVVMGTPSDDGTSLKVTSIKAAKKDDKKEDAKAEK